MSPADPRNQASAAQDAAQGKLPPEALTRVADRFRVLGSTSRLSIVNALMGGARSMTELSGATGLEQSNLSRHTAELERAGCVRRIRRGRQVFVEIADPSLFALCDIVCGSLREHADAVRRMFGAA
jgi:DNA-binding transcriptional ArsR family regulator